MIFINVDRSRLGMLSTNIYLVPPTQFRRENLWRLVQDILRDLADTVIQKKQKNK